MVLFIPLLHILRKIFEGISIKAGSSNKKYKAETSLTQIENNVSFYKPGFNQVWTDYWWTRLKRNKIKKVRNPISLKLISNILITHQNSTKFDAKKIIDFQKALTIQFNTSFQTTKQHFWYNNTKTQIKPVLNASIKDFWYTNPTQIWYDEFN